MNLHFNQYSMLKIVVEDPPTAQDETQKHSQVNKVRVAQACNSCSLGSSSGGKGLRFKAYLDSEKPNSMPVSYIGKFILPI